jgi:hypothetical protein
MKKIFTLILLISISVSIFPQSKSSAKCCNEFNKNHQAISQLQQFPDMRSLATKSSKGPLIDTTTCYDWDTITSDWVENTMQITHYNISNRLDEKLIKEWNGNAWEDEEMINYTYTSFGMNDVVITKNWNGTAWVNHKKSEYTYDTTTYNMEAYNYYTWNGTAWENVQQSLFTTSGGMIDEIIVQNWNNGSWEDTLKYICGYDFNMYQNLEIEYKWINAQWEESRKEEYANDYNGMWLERVTSIWDGAAWEYEHMYDYTYVNPYEVGEWIHSIWDGSSWVEYERMINTYDMGYTLLETLFQLWDGSAWQDDYRDTYLYPGTGSCYEIETISEYWSGAAWENDVKCFEVWCDLTIGISENDCDENVLLIYPNPACDYLNVEIDQKTEIWIFNSFGEEVFKKLLSESTRLDISNLSEGIYFINAQTKSRNSTNTFIKLF